MRFKEFMEDIVDKSDEFKKKKAANFQSRVMKAFGDADNGIGSQQEMELYVRDSIKKAVVSTNKKFSKFRLQLAPILKYFKNQPDYFIPNIFYLLGDADVDEGATGLTKADRDVLVMFTAKYSGEVENIIDEYMAELDKIKEWSDRQKWPAGKDSLTRYTEFGHAISLGNLAKAGLRELITGE